MNSTKTLRTKLIGMTLRFLERYFFDPKLRRVLKTAITQSLDKSNSKREDLIFLDIGANRGQTVKSLKAIFPKSRIYSFEPDPTIFKTLSNFSKISDVKCFNMALGKSSGRFPFWVSPIDETSTLHLPDIDSDWHKKKAALLGLSPLDMYKRIEVEVTTIDEFVYREKIDYIDLLKIDVEGGEFEVLLGASETFEKGLISVVQFESHNDDLRPSRTQEIQAFLSSFNFSKVSTIKHSFGDFYDEVWLKRL